MPLFAAMTADILPPLAAFCHRQLPEFVAICRSTCGAVSSHFNFHLLLTVEFFTIGLSCPVMTETAQRKRGGRAFTASWNRTLISSTSNASGAKRGRKLPILLFSEKGIRVTFYAPYLFYRRRLKRAAKPNWENAENHSEFQPARPNAAASQPQSRPSPLPKPAPFKRPNISKH